MTTFFVGNDWLPFRCKADGIVAARFLLVELIPRILRSLQFSINLLSRKLNPISAMPFPFEQPQFLKLTHLPFYCRDRQQTNTGYLGLWHSHHALVVGTVSKFQENVSLRRTIERPLPINGFPVLIDSHLTTSCANDDPIMSYSCADVKSYRYQLVSRPRTKSPIFFIKKKSVITSLLRSLRETPLGNKGMPEHPYRTEIEW